MGDGGTLHRFFRSLGEQFGVKTPIDSNRIGERDGRSLDETWRA